MAKGDRLKARLGPGEFEKPGEPNLMARYYFMDSIHRLAPEAVTALERDQDPSRWAARFGLHQVWWFVEVASSTLLMWQQAPGVCRYPVWAGLGFGGVVQEPHIRAWQYEHESEADFDARIARHKQEMREAAAAQGLIPTRELRNPEHLEWLVRRVIQRWKLEEIARGYPKSPGEEYDDSTITRAINAAADLVGLPRPSTLTPQRDARVASEVQ